jgi:septal ring factor EnvC (AmiA/AmiB activator)
MLTDKESIENIREALIRTLGVIRKGDKIQQKLLEEIKEQQKEINLLKEQVAILIKTMKH